MSKALRLCPLLLILVTQGLGAADRDWPQWRGPHRDAVSKETGLVDGWGGEGPRILWRIAAGAGFSSVSVSHDRLYTLWDEDDTQFLVCVDMRSP